MSYSIITKTLKGKVNEIPVSTHQLFHDYWLPLFKKHKLTNLSNLEYPHDFEKEELKELIKEFNELKPFIKGEGEIERLEFIIEKLLSINFNDYEYINFG